MKNLKKPDYSAKETFLTCISSIRDKDLKRRLTACKALIADAEAEFDSKFVSQIHTIAKEKIVNGNVTAKELENVYNYKMVKKGSPGRPIYDKIISAPIHGICPLCMHRSIESLDHYLPKTSFPRLATTPINLVPACMACNKIKTTKSPQKPEEATLNPYYDNIDDQKWLAARVNQTNPPTITFFISSPTGSSSLLTQRVKNHFTLFSLAKLYSVQAAVELSNINNYLVRLYSISRSKSVKQYLEEQADSRYRYDKNSWATALYIAISQDTWFCDGGFKMKI